MMSTRVRFDPRRRKSGDLSAPEMVVAPSAVEVAPFTINLVVTTIWESILQEEGEGGKVWEPKVGRLHNGKVAWVLAMEWVIVSRRRKNRIRLVIYIFDFRFVHGWSGRRMEFLMKVGGIWS
jgi:hypothetical protein